WASLDFTYAKSSRELALKRASSVLGCTRAIWELIKNFLGQELSALLRYSIAPWRPRGSQRVARGSGSPDSRVARLVAHFTGSRWSNNNCRLAPSIRGRSQANTSHATSGYRAWALRIPLKGPRYRPRSITVPSPFGACSSWSPRTLRKTFSQNPESSWYRCSRWSVPW